ncbi:protein-disulfide reductase DsbD domain-containing protein [Anaplasma bovis]|uniref:protein-disulfide reductase DsbD domain-containing protein n=1 Tax=Anaplasma bovis TaxID=186733 RepID=UPI002FF03E04
MILKIVIYCLVLQFLFTSPGMAALGAQHAVITKDKEHASVDVLVGAIDETTVEGAVHFKIQDGWHIYAADPGDTGVATTISLEGSKVLWYDIHWPKHEVDVLKIGKKTFTSNVYTSSVAFPFVAKFESGTKEIKVELQFAVCGETCIPTKKTLALDVSKSKFVDEKHTELIREWQDR